MDSKKFREKHGLLTPAQFALMDEQQEQREQRAYEKRQEKAAKLAKLNNDFFAKFL